MKALENSYFLFSNCASVMFNSKELPVADNDIDTDRNFNAISESAFHGRTQNLKMN